MVQPTVLRHELLFSSLRPRMHADVHGFVTSTSTKKEPQVVDSDLCLGKMSDSGARVLGGLMQQQQVLFSPVPICSPYVLPMTPFVLPIYSLCTPFYALSVYSWQLIMCASSSLRVSYVVDVVDVVFLESRAGDIAQGVEALQQWYWRWGSDGYRKRVDVRNKEVELAAHVYFSPSPVELC